MVCSSDAACCVYNPTRAGRRNKQINFKSSKASKCPFYLSRRDKSKKPLTQVKKQFNFFSRRENIVEKGSKMGSKWQAAYHPAYQPGHHQATVPVLPRFDLVPKICHPGHHPFTDSRSRQTSWLAIIPAIIMPITFLDQENDLDQNRHFRWPNGQKPWPKRANYLTKRWTVHLHLCRHFCRFEQVLRAFPHVMCHI